MYLVRKKNAKTVHIWTGYDTVCRMYSTGGLRKKAYEVVIKSDMPICHMCKINSTKKIVPTENHVIDKLSEASIKESLGNFAKRLHSPYDKKLVSSAIAETMENRRKYRGKEGEWK